MVTSCGSGVGVGKESCAWRTTPCFDLGGGSDGDGSVAWGTGDQAFSGKRGKWPTSKVYIWLFCLKRWQPGTEYRRAIPHCDAVTLVVLHLSVKL